MVAVTAVPEPTRADKIFTLAGVLIGVLLGALDQTIVAAAGPLIQRQLRVSAGLYPWITTSYLVASTVTVPIYGKLSDLYGRKGVLLAGIGIFLLGSLLCAASRGPLQLVFARAVQGLGSASLFVSAFAVVADLFPPAVRGRYAGLFAGVWAVSSVVGPLAGGVIADHLGWHWVFLVNVPVGLVALAFVVLRMPSLAPRAHRRAGAIDWGGATLLCLATVPLLVGLGAIRGEPAAGLMLPWPSGVTLGLLAMSLAALVGFIAVERRVLDPVLDLSLFRRPTFAWGSAAALGVSGSFFAGIVFLPVYMVNVMGLSGTAAGIVLTPMTLGMVAGNVGAGQIASHLRQYKPVLLVGLAILLVAFALLGFTLSATTTRTAATVMMVLVGIGLGPSIPLYTLALQNDAPATHVGVATSTATFARQMGGTIGLAILGSIYAAYLGQGGGTDLGAASGGHFGATLSAAQRDALTVATRHVYQAALVMAALGTVLTLRMPGLRLREHHGSPSRPGEHP